MEDVCAFHHRQHCLTSLLEALATSHESAAAMLTDAVELEHAAFVLASGCSRRYPLLVLKILNLLRVGRLQSLRREGEGKTANYVDLLQLPSTTLYINLPCWEQYSSNETLRRRAEALLRDLGSPDLSHIPDAGIRCGKCRSTDIVFDFLQTRSADEGTTVYCTCSMCGKRWKM